MTHKCIAATKNRITEGSVTKSSPEHVNLLLHRFVLGLMLYNGIEPKQVQVAALVFMDILIMRNVHHSLMNDNTVQSNWC